MNKLSARLDSPFDKAAVILTGIFVVFLIVFGLGYRPIEGLQNIEAIQAGTLPEDGFHPLLYPILAGVAGRILHDVAMGAKLVSNVMAGIFVFGGINKTMAMSWSVSIGTFFTTLNPWDSLRANISTDSEK